MCNVLQVQIELRSGLSATASGATSNAALPNGAGNDYAAIAKGMGLERVFRFDNAAALDAGFDAAAAANAPGHTFVVLEVEPFTAEEQKLEQPPFDGPEMKYRFGRAFERATGADIFGYRVS